MARVLGAEMTGDPMLARGCVEDMELMPEKQEKLFFDVVFLSCFKKGFKTTLHDDFNVISLFY